MFKISRQTQHHRRTDLAALKYAADGLPLIVSVDESIGPYVVASLAGVRLIAGRYGIAHAYIAGYAYAHRHPVEAWRELRS